MVLDRIEALEERLRALHQRLTALEAAVIPPAKTQVMPPAPAPRPFTQPSYDVGDD